MMFAEEIVMILPMLVWLLHGFTHIGLAKLFYVKIIIPDCILGNLEMRNRNRPQNI